MPTHEIQQLLLKVKANLQAQLQSRQHLLDMKANSNYKQDKEYKTLINAQQKEQTRLNEQQKDICDIIEVLLQAQNTGEMQVTFSE